MFFHMDSMKEFRSFIQSWNFTTIIIIIIGVKGGGDNNGGKQLMIIDGEGEFDQDVLIMGNNFIMEYGQLFKVYNGGQCAMVKNVTIKILHNFHQGH